MEVLAQNLMSIFEQLLMHLLKNACKSLSTVLMCRIEYLTAPRNQDTFTNIYQYNTFLDKIEVKIEVIH